MKLLLRQPLLSALILGGVIPAMLLFTGLPFDLLLFFLPTSGFFWLVFMFSSGNLWVMVAYLIATVFCMRYIIFLLTTQRYNGVLIALIASFGLNCFVLYILMHQMIEQTLK